MSTPEHFNQIFKDKLPGHLGIVVTHMEKNQVKGEMKVSQANIAPNGFLFAGSVVTLADTLCGDGCISNLPNGASGFTTIELKSNHLGTAREGTVSCVANAVHTGKTTQVWDAVATHKESGKTIALFRCTQMILYSKEK